MEAAVLGLVQTIPGINPRVIQPTAASAARSSSTRKRLSFFGSVSDPVAITAATRDAVASDDLHAEVPAGPTHTRVSFDDEVRALYNRGVGLQYGDDGASSGSGGLFYQSPGGDEFRVSIEASAAGDGGNASRSSRARTKRSIAPLGQVRLCTAGKAGRLAGR